MRHFRSLTGAKNILQFVIAVLFCLALISCGSGPQSKVGESEGPVERVDNGRWAINLNQAPPDTSISVNEVSYVALGKSVPSLAGMQITVEAWVYTPLTTGNVGGAIFARGGDDEGFMLFIANLKPFIIIKYIDRAATNVSPILQARFNTAQAYRTWFHVAGVFTTSNHTGVHATCTVTPGAESAASHLDIYVNGAYADCGSTEGRAFPALSIYNEAIGRSATLGTNWVSIGGTSYLVNPSDRNTLIIDEVRFWGVARSAADIAACRNAELVPGTGQCGMENAGLIGYWKLDEGASVANFSSDIADWSLTENNGGIEYCDRDCTGPQATSIKWDCEALAETKPGVACPNPWVDLASGGIPYWGTP
ncbi:MAG: LamG domain-containing protein [Nitrospirae bacterium]|nr:LamG domain-containing protein [Nitrospirota bacterium]